MSHGPAWWLPAALILLTGCAAGAADGDVRRVAPETGAHVAAAATAGPAAPEPGPLEEPVVSADLLVVGDRSLPEELVSRISALRGVRAVEPVSVASVAVAGRSLTVAAVDPASYRRFTPHRTAVAEEVWRRVAAGDVAVTHQIGSDLRRPLGGQIAFGRQDSAVPLRIGAHAALSPRVEAVVNHARGAQLGMPAANAAFVSTDGEDVAAIADTVERMVGRRAGVHLLTEPTVGSGSTWTATLTGGSVAAAVGSFGYRYYPDGSVEPDPRWVAAQIRTSTVPILGQVTCHRLLLPQLHAALAEIQAAELAPTIDAGDYGGCYVPRFIGQDPARGLSLHTWGIAVDLNVSGNQRGTAGTIDRRVVEIFEKWGFAWGGDWQWTDPMHFELAALVEPR